MSEIDWKDVAKKAVAKISDELSEAHRGATPWHGPTNTLAAFDNRAFPKKQIKFLKSRFKTLKIPVRAVAIHQDGGGFVMLIESINADLITDLLWGSYHASNPDTEFPLEVTKKLEMLERETAIKRLKKYELGLESWWDHQQTGEKGDPALYLHEFVSSFDENRKRTPPTPDGLKFIKVLKNAVAKFAKDVGVTADQAIRLFEAFPDPLDWKGRNVKQMYDQLPPTSTARRTPKKKKASPPKATKKKPKKIPVSKKKVKKTPVTKKKVVKKKVVKKKKKKR